MKELLFGVKPGVYKGEPPVNVHDVALYQEYGTETIPPRPAFRHGMDRALVKNRKLIGAQLKNITQRVLTGRRDDLNRGLTVMLTQIGKSAQAATKEIIRNGSEPPPNAPSTVAKKGFNRPLYETGLLLDHVGYEVRR